MHFRPHACPFSDKVLMHNYAFVAYLCTLVLVTYRRQNLLAYFFMRFIPIILRIIITFASYFMILDNRNNTIHKNF